MMKLHEHSIGRALAVGYQAVGREDLEVPDSGYVFVRTETGKGFWTLFVKEGWGHFFLSPSIQARQAFS